MVSQYARQYARGCDPTMAKLVIYLSSKGVLRHNIAKFYKISYELL